MAKYKSEVKNNAMLLYAEGNSLQEVADEIGCHHNTVIGWKTANDPQDWETFKEVIVAEKAKAAIVEVRKKTAESVSNQLDDTLLLRRLAKRLLIGLIKDLVDGNRKVSEATVKMVRDLERTFNGIQQQQNACFDLPTHRLQVAGAKSPFAMSDKDLRKMPNSELMRMITNINTSDEGE